VRSANPSIERTHNGGARLLAPSRPAAPRRTLAISLYGRAAQLSMEGKNPSALLAEANAMDYPREDILEWFADAQPNVVALVPELKRLLSKSRGAASGRSRGT